MCAPYTQRRLPSPANLSSAARVASAKSRLSLEQGLSVDGGQRTGQTWQNHWRPEHLLCARYFEISVLLQILFLFKGLLIYFMCLGVLPACMSVGGQQKP